MATTTPNLSLKKPASTDFYNIQDHNDNMDILDAAVAGKVPTTRTINSKALSADVTLTQDDVGDGTTNKAYTATEKTKLAGLEKAVMLTGLLDKDNWLTGTGNYYQQLTISGLATTGFAYTVTPTADSFKAYGENGVYMDDVETTNTATFYADSIPTIDLNVLIMKVVTA
jgi:hypothetical protein